ncbi:GNAT family N-acetyltransferase [Yunchengibacter salinarum]|uniref:GNAT family N-acetyltransferase n=1 Tax=Yunchengibacter salinarum TaxID=3133399 RepID=UPI0035B5B8ED
MRAGRGGAPVAVWRWRGDRHVLTAAAGLHAAAFDPTPETPWSASALARIAAMPGGALFLTGPVRAPVGLCLVQGIQPETDLVTLAVAPDAQGHGVARALLRQVAARLDGVHAMMIEVRESNSPARALYARLGATPVGERPNYYRTSCGGTEKAILLRWDFDEGKQPDSKKPNG